MTHSSDHDSIWFAPPQRASSSSSRGRGPALEAQLRVPPRRRQLCEARERETGNPRFCGGGNLGASLGGVEKSSSLVPSHVHPSILEERRSLDPRFRVFF